MQVSKDVDALLRAAISRRRQIRFWYRGKARVAEPHDFGVQNGTVRLLVYQVGGRTNSGHVPAWRLIDVPTMTELEILDRTFPGNRPTPSGKHHHWNQILLRVR